VILIFKIIVVIVVFVVWLFISTQDLCPSCGTELAEDYAYPGQKVDYCACGWHRRD
jgi:hypothetical protein